MGVLSSLDTSLFTTPTYASQELNTFQPVKTMDNAKQETPNVAAEDTETPKVDLSNYYSNVQAQEFNSDVLSSVVQAEHNLGDAVMSAISNGMSPSDAANIQMAKTAYVASMKVAEVASSTFELMI